MLYFAYGSNIVIAQMAVRCPNARRLGTGILQDYRFRIDGRGFATVDRERGARVLGLVWHLTPADEASLDSYEEIPALYARAMLDIRQEDQCIPMLVYLSTDRMTGRPAPEYLESIVRAAQLQEFNSAYLDELASWEMGVRREAS